MRGIQRPYSVLLHFFPGWKADFLDLRIGHTFMGTTEEGQGSIWINFFCGNIRNGYLRCRDGNGRLFSKESSQKDAESLSVGESEEVISSQHGDVKEDGGHLGKRKGFRSSGKKLEILNEIHDILKTGSQADKLLYQMGSSISAEIAYMVMKSEKDVKMIFRFFLWAMQKQSLISFRGLQNLMIEILKESREFEVAWDLLREVRREGKMTNAASFNVLISAYGKVGMVEKAIESFVVMEEEFSCRPDIFTWNTMLDILVNDQMIEIAWALYHRMLTTDCSPDTTTLNILIRCLCKAGKTQEALELYDEMTARGIVANMTTYGIIIKSLCQAGKINMATQLLASMKANNCSPGIVIYNIIIDGLCKNGQVDQAFELLNIIKEMNVSPCEYTYTSLIHGLFRAGRFDEACKYYKDLFEAQTPNLVLYTVMIDAYCEAGRVVDAFHIFNEMIRTRCLPDTVCYNTLIKGLCKVGLVDEARSVKSEMLQKGYLLDVVTYTTLIYGLCETGLVDEAHDMFDKMPKTGCFPNVFTYNTLIDGLFKVGEVTKACILFYQMELGNSPTFFLSIAQGSKHFGDSADLQALADGRCGTGRILEAYKLHKRLLESGAVPDVITYNTMINGLCKIDGRKRMQSRFCNHQDTYDIIMPGRAGR
ncbi:hypothetical protein SUGI_0767210 [Cryptomeria japonica]|uniref:pentatricopeptide repeat-containing protein At1g79540 isoform X2 n=1 Tax=Cryptomeria japonica TaxID=3369 RepID=UPI002414C9B0|nr:pentatricopeptide repeat-containing protein At1g79540 isoform X2 [Cryptomeria japonica]GLJ37754.1 hypothetical protein SUGI_0767210 [Cryptomeria japonica]